MVVMNDREMQYSENSMKSALGGKNKIVTEVNTALGAFLEEPGSTVVIISPLNEKFFHNIN